MAKGRLRWLLKSRGVEFALVVAFCITSSCQSSTPASTGAGADAVSPADFEDSLRDVASRGFNIVFAHRFEYADAALKVGRLSPKTWFIVTSGSGSAVNVSSLTFKIEKATTSKA